MRLIPLVVLLLAGCRGEEARAPATVTEATDSVAAEEWSVRELRHAPKYFLASGWAGPDTLWGLAGNTPVFLQVDGTEYRAVRRSYWDVALSPRGALAGIDGRGVWVDDRLLLDRSGDVEGDLSGPLAWSPDGSRLFVRRVREGPAIHLAIDVESGAVTRLPARADEPPSADRVIPFDSTRALLVTRREGAHDPVHDISLRPGAPGARPLLSVPGRDVRVAWSPDGRRFAVSAAGEEIDAASGSVEAYYRTWIVESR